MKKINLLFSIFFLSIIILSSSCGNKSSDPDPRDAQGYALVGDYISTSVAVNGSVNRTDLSVKFSLTYDESFEGKLTVTQDIANVGSSKKLFDGVTKWSFPTTSTTVLSFLTPTSFSAPVITVTDVSGKKQISIIINNFSSGFDIAPAPSSRIEALSSIEIILKQQ